MCAVHQFLRPKLSNYKPEMQPARRLAAGCTHHPQAAPEHRLERPLLQELLRFLFWQGAQPVSHGPQGGGKGREPVLYHLSGQLPECCAAVERRRRSGSGNRGNRAWQAGVQ